MAGWTLPRSSEASLSGVRIAVDAMGGDHGPSEVVPGALDYARSHPEDVILLVGREDRIRAIAPTLPPNVVVSPASQVIEMDEHPALALREKKDASILVACELVHRGEADAVVTAGHTGAGMAAAVLRIGRLPRVDRPALAVQMVRRGSPFVLLDIGANPDSSAENLAQYARMGTIFAERVLGIPGPRVALLSIGEEKGKGDLRIQRATELLDGSGLRFVGNVEGKDLVADMADVIVTDAVVGNVVIKFFEGLSTFIFDLFREQFRSGLRGRLAYLLLRPGIRRIRDVFDYEQAGGSPLLGIKGAVIITHGRARRRMIGFAVDVAGRMARERVPERIAEALRADDLERGAAGLHAEAADPAEAPAEASA
ncbi:MAG TPA: phosphate acyltransferase PlsX [Candidatus Limnocylindrales bacterium]|nr:phosphate acyltransferase PlsX [Candidatus Limnocylindrales bacterium]